MPIHVLLVVELLLWTVVSGTSQDPDVRQEGSGVWDDTAGSNETDYWTMIDDEDFVEEITRMSFIQVEAIPSKPCDSWIAEVANQVAVMTSLQEEIVRVVGSECQCSFDISNGSVVCVDDQLPTTHIVYTAKATRPVEFSTNEEFLHTIEQWTEMGPTVNATLDSGEKITLKVVTSVENPTVVPPDTPPGTPPSTPPDTPTGTPPDTPPGTPPSTPPDIPTGTPPDMPPGDDDNSTNIDVNEDLEGKSPAVKLNLCIGVLMFGTIFAQFV